MCVFSEGVIQKSPQSWICLDCLILTEKSTVCVNVCVPLPKSKESNNRTTMHRSCPAADPLCSSRIPACGAMGFSSKQVKVVWQAFRVAQRKHPCYCDVCASYITRQIYQSFAVALLNRLRNMSSETQSTEEIGSIDVNWNS